MATSPRVKRRYDTDLTDQQWAWIEPLLPPPSKDGPKEKHSRREIVNAILYVVRTGCAWRHLPKDFPPWSTVFWWFQKCAQRDPQHHGPTIAASTVEMW
jgi:transposase